MSEFTLDIQLTELGFSSWNFPLCEPPSVKEPFLPAQSTSEKPEPETETSTDYSEDAHISPSDLANKSFLQDHQYFSPFKHMPSRNAETAQSNSKNIPVEKKDKAICNSWNKARRRDTTEQRENDEEQDEQEEKKNDEICSEVSQDVPSLTPDDSMSEEEKIHEEVELILSDDEEYDYEGVEEEEEEEEEEEDYIEDEKEEDEEDNSSSEMTGCRDNEENRCHVCDLTFSSLFLLREHLNMHTGVRPYRCDECGKQFCQLVNYRAHLRSHSQKAATAIHCRVCSATFEKEELLKEHLDTNHFEKEFYQCDFCKQIFTDLDVCKVHVEAHRQQAKRHLCLKCGSSFRLRNSLLRHLEWHSRGIFCCTDCDRTFSTKSSLLRHSFSHLGVLPYTCLKCKRHFRLASLYRSHECKPESIQCMACLVFFDSQEDFDKHKKDTGCWGHQGTLPTKTDEIRCMECGLVFASVEELKKHGSTHQRVLKCAECGMGFRSSLMLMSHMGGHAGQRPCLCQDCGLGFPHQQGYDSHLKTCGMVTPPVPAVKKPKPKATPSTQIMKPVAPTIIFQTIGQATNPATFSNSLREVHMIPLANQNKPADGRWKFALNKESPSGMPVVMLLPVSGTQYTSTLEPQRKSAQTLPPPPLVLKTPSSAPHVVSLPVAPSGSVISKEAQSAELNIPPNTLIPVESHDSTPKTRWAVLEDHSGVQVFGTETLKAGEQTSGVAETNQGVNGIAQVAENEEKSQSNMKTDALVDEKANSESSSDTVPLNPTPPVTPLCLIKENDDDNVKNRSSNLKDVDSSPVMAGDEINVSLKPKCLDSSERQMPDSSETDSGNPVSGSSEITCHNKSGKEQRCFHEVESSDRMCAESPMENGSRGQNESGFDVEVEISEDVDLSSMEVEIGDEDSGVDMLEGELHECVTCGQVLPEKEMVQHHIKHASVSDKPELSSVNCASKPTAASPPASPLRKRLRSGTVL